MNGIWEPLKIQSLPKCKARKKFCRAAYGVYASKKFFPQRSITSHLVAVFWRLSGMVSSSISWDEMWIFRGSHDYSSMSWRYASNKDSKNNLGLRVCCARSEEHTSE